MKKKESEGTRTIKKRKSERIVLNVSGEIYETLEETLSRYPATVLGDLNEHSKCYCPNSKQYFFHRNRMCFGAILFFYQSQGILRRPHGIPLEVFEEECLYFRLPEYMIQMMKMDEGIIIPVLEEPVERTQYSSVTFKSKFWDILERPETSLVAWFYGLVILAAIVVSIWTICLATTSLIIKNANSVEHLRLIDLALNVYFLIDIVLRIVFTPDRIEFIKFVTTWIDVISCLAYFISILIQNTNNSSLLHFLIFVRVLRVFRLFRLAKHFRRLQIAGEILLACTNDLKLFMVCLMLITIFYGSLMQFIERDKSFLNVLDACWWAVQTITTVGYGDILPVTVTGKLFAGCFMAFGTQLTLLPVLTIVNKFTSLYTKNE